MSNSAIKDEIVQSIDDFMFFATGTSLEVLERLVEIRTELDVFIIAVKTEINSNDA